MDKRLAVTIGPDPRGWATTTINLNGRSRGVGIEIQTKCQLELTDRRGELTEAFSGVRDGHPQREFSSVEAFLNPSET